MGQMMETFWIAFGPLGLVLLAVVLLAVVLPVVVAVVVVVVAVVVVVEAVESLLSFVPQQSPAGQLFPVGWVRVRED